MREKQSPDIHACIYVHLAFYEVLGKKWAALILEALRHRPVAFCELHRPLKDHGLSDRVLGERLQNLVSQGLVAHEGRLYSLTSKGEDILPAIDAARKWAMDHCKAPERSKDG